MPQFNAGGDWTDLLLKTGISLVSGIIGLFVGVWRWGQSSARADQAVKDDYDGKIHTLREEMRTILTNQSHKFDDDQNLFISQFKESFDGIRRQFDEHKFYTEKEFMKKEDFRYFLAEYREDIRDLKTSIAQILDHRHRQ